jgi:hypothetical protein
MKFLALKGRAFFYLQKLNKCPSHIKLVCGYAEFSHSHTLILHLNNKNN